jgi:hypothetical protein
MRKYWEAIVEYFKALLCISLKLVTKIAKNDLQNRLLLGTSAVNFRTKA